MQFKKIYLWDTDTRSKVKSLLGHTGKVICLAALSNGHLASGGMDGTMRVWDPATGGLALPPFTVPGSHAVTCVAALPGGAVAFCATDKHFRVLRTDGCIEASRRVVANAMMAMPDHSIVTAGEELLVWDYTRMDVVGELLGGHNNIITALALLPCGLLASGGSDHALCLWDVKNGTLVARVAVGGPISSLGALAGSAGVAVGRSDIFTVSLRVMPSLKEIHVLQGHASSVSALCGLPDGRLAAGCDGSIVMWG